MRVVLLALALCVSTPASAANTLRVGAGAYGSLAAAVSAAQSGDTILVDPGTWAGGVTVDKDLTIAGVNSPVITGNTRDLFVVSGGTVVLSGLTLHPTGGRGVRVDGGHVSLVALTVEDNNGNAFDGAGVRVSGTATVDITSCEFRRNSTHPIYIVYDVDGLGGHLYVNGTSRAATVVNITDSTFEDGTAEQGGAIYARAATVRVTDSLFTGNVSQGAAGTLRASDVALTLDGVTISGGRTNRGNTDGASLYADGSITTLTGTSISDGRAQRNGGALYVSGGSLTLDQVSLTANRGVAGGAAYVTGGAVVRVTDSSSCGNVATGAGGAWSLGAGVDAAWVRTTSISDSGAGGFLAASGAASVVLDHVDVLDAGGTGAAVVSGGGGTRITSSLIAWSAAAGLDAPGATVLYDAFFANAGGDTAAGTTAGAGVVTADPLLPRYRRDGLCGNDDVRVSDTSPLIDVGDPAELDPDGSRTDIGAIGGAGADPNVFDDDDGDGFLQAYDCDDLQIFVHPGALEVCDGLDSDCDGVVDGPVPVAAPVWYVDADRDGYGLDGTEVSACVAPPGTTADGGDCDDANADAHPNAAEVCDGIDNNCVGGVDGSDAQGQLTWYQDADGDGHGARQVSLASCSAPAGYVLAPDDCNDKDPEIAPGKPEHCDGVDEDCDTFIDAPDAIGATTWTYDGDGDGFGNGANGEALACTRPDDYAREDGDCDDGDPDVHPRAPESCEGAADANCDGFTGSTDHDEDGAVACEDCDDGDDTTFPGAADEPYDGIVTDCESLSDFDADRDGYDALAYGGDDCDDADAGVAPGLSDTPGDGVDQDCDGEDMVGVPGPDGCGCKHGGASGGAAGAALVGLTLALARRRRAA